MLQRLVVLGILLLSYSVFAMNGRTTYQAKILKPDGYPLEATNVHFRFTVLDTVGSCILYVEEYAAVNMQDSGGLISFALGNGARSFPTSGTTQTFQSVFDNSVSSYSCQNAGIYNPISNDTRRIVMQFNDGTGWQTLPAMTINAVPYAMYADKANSARALNNKADTAFVEYATLASLNCNAATHAITFNGVSFSCIPVGSAGSGGITNVTTSGSVLTTSGTASEPVIGIQAVSLSQDGYLTAVDYAEFKAKLSASSTQIINTLGYEPANSVSLTSLTNTVAASFAAITSSQWVTSGADITYSNGNVGVGVSSPTSMLEVKDLTGNLDYNAVIKVVADRSNSERAVMETYTENSTGADNFIFMTSKVASSAVASITSPPSVLMQTFRSTPMVAGDYFGAYLARATDTTGSHFRDAAGLRFMTPDSITTEFRIGLNSLAGSPGGGLGRAVLTGTNSGNIGVDMINPTAKLNIAAGTNSVAPIKLTSGTLLTSPQSGTIEYDGSKLYFTDGSNTRRALASTATPGSFDNTSAISNSSGNIHLAPNNLIGSVVVSATTPSTSSDTGALVVKGGVGIGSDLVVSGSIKTNFNSNGITDGLFTNAQSTTAPMGYGFYAQGNATDGLHMVSWGSAHLVLDSDNNDSNRYFSISKDAKNVGSSVELFRLNENGNVGIGTTAPAATLDVSGSIRYSGSLSSNHIANSFTDAELNTKFGYTASTTSTFRQVQLFRDDAYPANIATIEGVHTSSMLFSNYDHTGHGTNGFFFGKVPFGGNYKNNGITLFTIRNTGNVGIGTINPSSRLDIANIGSNAIAQKPRGIAIATTDLGGSTGDAGVQISTPYGAGTSLTTNLRNIRGTGSAYIGFELATTTNHPIRFLTNSTGENVNERMRITGSGNVGIGTSSPSDTLHVVGGGIISGNNVILQNTAGISNQAGKDVYDLRVDGFADDLQLVNNISDVPGKGRLLFTSKNTTAMVIDGSNVGIGTTNPLARLHVSPTSNLEGFLLDNSSSESPNLIFRNTSVSGTWNIDTSNVGLRFFTEGGIASGGGVVHMLLNQSGNLAVGTNLAASMTAKFNIVGSSTNEIGQYIHNTNPNGYAVIRMNNNYGVNASGSALHTFGSGYGSSATAYKPLSTTLSGFDSGGLNLHAHSGDINFFSGGSSSANHRMTITDSGYVGIGTATPEMNLDLRSSADSSLYLNIQHNRNHVGATNPKVGLRLENNSEASGGPNQAALIYLDSYQNNNAGHLYISNRSANKKVILQATTVGSVVKDAVIIDSTGMVGIATSSPAQALDVVGNIQTSGCLYYANSSIGTCASDERIKKDIIGFDLGLEALLKINPVKFKYNGLAGFKNDGKEQLGVIAQDVERAAPELVKKQWVQLNASDKEKTEIKIVDYGAFTYVIINAVKDLYYYINQQTRQIAAIEETKAAKAEIEKLKLAYELQKQENIKLQKRLERLEKIIDSQK